MKSIRLPREDQDRLRRLLAETDGRGAEHADAPTSSPRNPHAGESLRRYCELMRAAYGDQAPGSARKTMAQRRAELDAIETSTATDDAASQSRPGGRQR